MERTVQNESVYRLRIGLSLLLCTLVVGYGALLGFAAEGEGVSEEADLKVYFLDVGQGDSALIITPSGNRVLIDGGPSPSLTKTLGPLMPLWGDREIDLVIATHADADHIGGLPALLEEYRVGMTLEPRSSSETAVYAAWQILEEQEGAIDLLAERGQIFELDQGVYLTILYPGEDLYGLEGNDASVIARLSYGSTCFIFTGDASTTAELELVRKDRSILDCDVLKVGHHGSKTSTHEGFVAAISPEHAVISAGKNNRYGHPHPEVVTTLKAANANVVTTAEEGTILFSSDGLEVKREL